MTASADNNNSSGDAVHGDSISLAAWGSLLAASQVR